LSGNVSFRNLVVSNASVLSLQGAAFADSITLRSNAVLTVPALVALDLTVSNMVIDASSRVDLMGKGYAGGTGGSGDGQGPGGGRRTIRDFGGGGSYGGLGGGSVSEGLARAVYGVFTNPMDFGSGG